MRELKALLRRWFKALGLEDDTDKVVADMVQRLERLRRVEQRHLLEQAENNELSNEYAQAASASYRKAHRAQAVAAKFESLISANASETGQWS